MLTGAKLTLVCVALCLGLPWGSAVQLRGDSHAARLYDGTEPHAQTLPVVLWHGMGDSCCAPYSIGAIKDTLEETLGVFVYSISTGANSFKDVFGSYFGDVNDQVAQVCAELRNVPELAQGYNAVGFSQGGQFLRAVLQRCQHTGPRMHTLVTMGAQHQGIMNVPGCNDLPDNSVSLSTCQMMQQLLARGAYLPYIRDHVVQAQYFKDPNHLDEYLSANPFLPDINNERDAKNPLYASNLASLKKLVLFRFAADDTVVPRDSAWFSFYDGENLQGLTEQLLYTEDWIGLRALDEAGGLIFDEAPGQHMQFTLDWFTENVTKKYLL